MMIVQNAFVIMIIQRVQILIVIAGKIEMVDGGEAAGLDEGRGSGVLQEVLHLRVLVRHGFGEDGPGVVPLQFLSLLVQPLLSILHLTLSDLGEVVDVGIFDMTLLRRHICT